MKYLILVLIVFTTYAATAQKRSSTTDDALKLQGLDTAFRRMLKDFHAAGFAVAVVRKNKVIYAKGFGYRDLEKKQPVTPNTAFAIGSCTKALTATLIGQLQHEDKLDMDKPVNFYLPALRFYNDAMNSTITVRDMMTHRTGLPRHDLSWGFFPTDSRDSLLQRIQFQEPTAPVRESFQYNNFMYMALGAVVEQLTGKSWETNIRENILGPLGMTASQTSYSHFSQLKERAIGYNVYHNHIIHQSYDVKRDGDGMAPCGAISSTANDMTKWLIAWINGGKFEGKQIIPEDYYRQAISSQMVVNDGLPSQDKPELFFRNYGLGWFLSSYKGHYRVEHGGNVSGFSTSTCFFPTDSIGIIVMANQDGSFLPNVIRNLITDRLLGKPQDDWAGYYLAQIAEGEKQEEAIAKGLHASHKELPPSHPISDFTGNYVNPGYGKFRVVIKKDSLYAVSAGGSGWLKHYSYDTFDFYGKDEQYGLDTTAIPFRLQFLLNNHGDVQGISGVYQEGLKPIVFTKEPEIVALAVHDLQKYTGSYDLGGAIIKVYTKPAGGLYVLSPNMPEYQMLPMGKDKFSIKGASGYFAQFEQSPSNLVTGVTFIQPGGSFKAIKQ